MFGSSTTARIDSSSDFKVAHLSLNVMIIRVTLSFATTEPSNSVKASSTATSTFLACSLCALRIFLFLVDRIRLQRTPCLEFYHSPLISNLKVHISSNERVSKPYSNTFLQTTAKRKDIKFKIHQCSRDHVFLT